MNQRHPDVLLTGLAFPEGPAFAPNGSLWLVELKGGALVRLHEGAATRYIVGGNPNGLAIDRQGQIWFCDAGQNAIRRFEVQTGSTETMVGEIDGKLLAKPNDLAFDALGNLVFTCPGDSRQTPDGYVGVRRPDGTKKKITEGKYFPNGLAFRADGRSLVIAETYKHRLWLGDWNPETAEWTNAKVWCQVGGPPGPGGPDGMAFGEDGNLYVAVYGVGEIRVVSPAGQVIDRLAVSGRNPTNCAFDPFGQHGLVITEAETGRLLQRNTTLKGILPI